LPSHRIDDIGGRFFGMPFPGIARNAPVRTPVERRATSEPSMKPYERASVRASGMTIMSAANTTAVVI
jgi:hypothetical protein